MNKDQREQIADRITRALTDAYNRTGEMPSEEDLRAAVVYVLETSILESSLMKSALEAAECELVTSMAYLTPAFRKNYQALLLKVREALGRK